jgi:hypothetical protein
MFRVIGQTSWHALKCVLSYLASDPSNERAKAAYQAEADVFETTNQDVGMIRKLHVTFTWYLFKSFPKI